MTDTERHRVANRIVELFPSESIWQRALLNYWLLHSGSVLMVRDGKNGRASVFDDSVPFRFWFDAYGSDT